MKVDLLFISYHEGWSIKQLSWRLICSAAIMRVDLLFSSYHESLSVVHQLSREFIYCSAAMRVDVLFSSYHKSWSVQQLSWGFIYCSAAITRVGLFSSYREGWPVVQQLSWGLKNEILFPGSSQMKVGLYSCMYTMNWAGSIHQFTDSLLSGSKSFSSFENF